MILFLSINVISANEINENDINSIDSSNLVGVDSVDNTNQFSSNMDGESLQADNVQSNLLSSNMNGETLQRDNLQSNLSSEDNCIASNAVGSLENEDAVSNTDSSAKNEEITSNTDSSTNNEITSNVGSSANNDEIISNTASSVNINDKSVLGTDNNNTTASTLKENKATKVKTVFTISHTSVLKGTAVHIYLKDHEGNPIVGKKVTLVINKLTITETTNHLGEVSIKISDPVGTHSLKVHFEGDDEHLSHSDSFTLNVYMLKTKIYVHSTSVARGRYLYVYLKDKHGNAISGKKLTIKIKGKNYKVSTNKNGRAYLKISQGIGKYPVKVTFNGGKSDDYSSMSYYSSSKSFTLKVYKQATKITVLSKTVVKGQYLIAYLKTSDGRALAKKRVLIRFNNIKYYRTTNKNGMAKLKIKKLGTFSLKISYSGSSYYKPSSRSFKGKCTIMPTKIVLQNSSVVRGKYLYAYLRDKDNKGIAKAKLIISFKGVKYTRTTNANGRVYLKINAEAKKYSIKITYAGSKNYKKSTKSTKIRVLSNATAKIIADNGTFLGEYSVRLTDKNGNPLVNQTLKFIISPLDHSAGSYIPITQKTIIIDTDRIYSEAKDIKWMNDLASALRAKGYTVIVSDRNPNAHNTDIKGKYKDACVICIFGGVDSGMLLDMSSSWYQNLLKKYNNRVVLAYTIPPNYVDLATCTWLKRAHDDNYSPKNFTGLSYPGTYLNEHGFDYIYGRTASEMADNFLNYAVNGLSIGLNNTLPSYYETRYVTTDENGFATIAGLSSGNYKIQISYSNSSLGYIADTVNVKIEIK